VIDALLEEFGDEWLAKCMFHFRWSKPADTQTSSSYLAYAMNMTSTPEQGEAFARRFAERQISRIGVVGSNETTGPLIEESWKRYLHVFDRHLQNQPFLLGSRPGAGDFGCVGPMTMRVLTDPTPQAVSRLVSPRAFAWTEAMEDHSGLEVDDAEWIDLDAPPETLNDLLCEVGRLFVPFMLENAKAVANGAKTLECELDGRPWVQEAFVYQAKCLTWLKQRYDNLGEIDKSRLDKVLSGTGCEALFAE
jgi:glutathione S-transferase